jgi:hypothetical protein
MRVQPDSKYLLVSTEPFPRSDVAREVELMCQGVRALFLEMPSALTPEWEQALRQLQVTPAKSIEVWPAGLAAVAWDGEGHGEWLASETPTLAIRSDHAIDELTIAKGAGDSLSLALTDVLPGEPIFIELPALAVGLHKFSVAARSGNGVASEVIGDLDVVMRVREARPWSPQVTPHGPLEVEVDPAVPSLEQLWEGKAAVVVRGPAGRQVRCRVRMFARAKGAPSFERQLPPMTLPLSSAQWTRHFETNLKEHKAAQHAYDDAYICEVDFSADELGSFSLRCEREFKPLRWSLRRDAASYTARLHDDAGSGVPVIEHYSFERPTAGEKLANGSEHKAPRNGGLYVAKLGEFRASFIVPPVVKDLADLGCEPRLDENERTPAGILRLLSFAQLWATARLSGALIAGVRQRAVIRAITAQISGLVGGQSWARAEANVASPRGLAELKRNISQNRLEAGVGAKLQLDAAKFAEMSPAGRAASLASLAESFRLVTPSPKPHVVWRSSVPGGPLVRAVPDIGPEHAAWLAEFALRMASDPMTLGAWAGEHLDTGIKKLLEAPTLARAARFLVLAVDQQSQPTAAVGEIYAGWGWSA